MIKSKRLNTEAVLRIGEVTAVTGRVIHIEVDLEKNLSELFFDGDILQNIAVGSYIDIRKGFLSLIGKVEGEIANTDNSLKPNLYQNNLNRRILTVSLVGYIDRLTRFTGGTKELPLIGNAAFLLTKEKVHQVHSLIKNEEIGLEIAVSENEGYEISLPIDGLINSHIAIFGNTGSGKSNTLAIMFQEFISKMQRRNIKKFEKNCKILLLDFNGEYIEKDCLTTQKETYKLSTRSENGDKIPLSREGFLDIEILSILSNATEKTQKPFLKRALSLYLRVTQDNNSTDFFRNILKNQVMQILQMSDKIRAYQLIDYLRQILPEKENDIPIDLISDLEWHNVSNEFKLGNSYLQQTPDQIKNTIAYQCAQKIELSDDIISDLVTFCYVQLIYDVLSNRAQNEHIAPVINKLKSKEKDIRKIFSTTSKNSFFKSNVVVVSLTDVNLEMRKMIPLLICKKVYQDHKLNKNECSLNIIIDEAHNILSRDSFRESESWKDYRLETFEEIIKEGRKFGVFVTIASQRPSDISHTITSQAHNYFIHRLLNQKDLQSISNAVSYIDKLTEESIPTLPTGICIFSGMASSIPLKLGIKPLPENQRPKSKTLSFSNLID